MKKSFMYGLILLLQTGCITTAYRKSNDEYGSSLREFDTQASSSFKVFGGIRKTTLEADGTTTYHLQFEGPLKGTGRYLDVIFSSKRKRVQGYDLIPGKGLVESSKEVFAPGEIRFLESENKISGESPAYLVMQVTQPFYHNSEQGYFYSILEQKVNQPSHPGTILKKHFDFELKDPEAPLGLVILNLASTEKYSADALVWEKGVDGAAVVSSIGVDLDSYEGPRFGIEWKVRNRPLFLLRQGGYIGTFLADVVSSPVQLVMVILTALSGGGVR